MDKDLYIELLEEKVKRQSKELKEISSMIPKINAGVDVLIAENKKLESFKKIVFKHRDKQWDEIKFFEKCNSDELTHIYRQRWLGIHLAIKEFEEQE